MRTRICLVYGRSFPVFSPWSPLIIFPRQFFACALPSERLELGYQVLRKVPTVAAALTGGEELAWLRRRLGVSERGCHSVLGIPISKSLAFWAFPSHITAAFWASPGTLPGCSNP